MKDSKRQWRMDSPYNYNMPKPPSYHSQSVPGFVMCAVRIMDYQGIPNKAFWNRQPNSQTAYQSTELTRFIRKVYDEFEGNQNYNQISTSKLENAIPFAFNYHFGFKNTVAHAYLVTKQVLPD